MSRILIFMSIFVSGFSLAESINHNGQKYDVEITKENIECKDFQLSLQKRSLPFSSRESKIPHKITMGHYGYAHLLSQSFTFASNQVKSQQQTIDSMLPSYQRIDPNRPYVATAVSCVDKHSVIVSFWGGGNCKDVCEAWSLVTFSKKGKVISSKGLTYPEFRKYD